MVCLNYNIDYTGPRVNIVWEEESLSQWPFRERESIKAEHFLLKCQIILIKSHQYIGYVSACMYQDQSL